MIDDLPYLLSRPTVMPNTPLRSGRTSKNSLVNDDVEELDDDTEVVCTIISWDAPSPNLDLNQLLSQSAHSVSYSVYYSSSWSPFTFALAIFLAFFTLTSTLSQSVFFLTLPLSPPKFFFFRIVSVAHSQRLTKYVIKMSQKWTTQTLSSLSFFRFLSLSLSA